MSTMILFVVVMALFFCTANAASTTTTAPKNPHDNVQLCVCHGCDANNVNTPVGVVSSHSNSHDCYYLNRHAKIYNSNVKIPLANAFILLQLATMDHSKYFRTTDDTKLGRGYINLYPEILPKLDTYKQFISNIPKEFKASNLPSPNRVDVKCLYWYMSPSGHLIHDCNLPDSNAYFFFETSKKTYDTYNLDGIKMGSHKKDPAPNLAAKTIPTIFLTTIFISMQKIF